MAALFIQPSPVLARLQPGQMLAEGMDPATPWSLPAYGDFAVLVSATGLQMTPEASGARTILAVPATAGTTTLALSLAAGSGASPLTVRGFARVDLLGTNATDTVSITGATEAWVSTGDGADTITLTEAKGGTLQIDAGAGNDTVTLRGNGQTKAQVQLGNSWDRLTLSGMAVAEVDAGFGDDLIVLTPDGSYRISGGAGNDGLILNARRSDLAFALAADGALLISRGNATATITEIERIRFADGTVLSASEVAALAQASAPIQPAKPVVQAPMAPVVTPPPTQATPLPVEPGDANGVAALSGTRQVGLFSKPEVEILTGGEKNDVFYAGRDDTLIGGKGDDHYILGDSNLAVERPGEGIDTIYYTGNGAYTLGADVENLTLTATGNRPVNGKHIEFAGMVGSSNGIGNALANIITGGGGDNILDGRGGNDVLSGGAGRDSFVFGPGYQQDVVQDFTPGMDKIWIISGARNFAELQDRIIDSTAGAVIRLSGGDTLTLAGRKAAELSAKDFSFAVDFSRYRLSFADEFDSFSRFDGRSAPDGGTWQTRMRYGDGSMINQDDDQAFVDVNYKGLGLDPFSIVDGALRITGTWHPDLKSQLDGKEFVAGVITTNPTFAQTYGYFEARMALPDWKGGFPAFWLLPTDGSWPPEIDILEQLGRSPGEIYQMGNVVKLDTTQFHTYGLEWTAERLAWFVDGQLTYEVANTSFHKPIYLLLNYAMGGSWAGEITKPAMPGGEAGSVLIDYARAYELQDGAAPQATRPDGAGMISYSFGTLAPGAKPALANSFTYQADVTGSVEFIPTDFNFAAAKGWNTVKAFTDRAADSYRATGSNPYYNLNVQVSDTDGGSYSFGNLTMADIRLGGTKASSVVLDKVQTGYVATGTGNDTVTLSNHQAVLASRASSFEVRTGDGHDRITGWTQGTGRLEAYGGAGDDSLIGSGANDLLEGGTGNDHLTGSAGSDVFVFVRGQGGHDIITDFTPRTDLVRLVGYTAAEMQQTETTAGVLVSLPDAQILLQGLKLSVTGDYVFQYA